MEAEKLTINIKEAARMYGICENSFRKLVNRSDFPKIKCGRRLIIIKSQLVAYMEKLATQEEKLIHPLGIRRM